MIVKSAFRVIQILDLLAERREGMTVQEISDALAIPQSSAFNLLNTLFESDTLTYERAGKMYALGSKAVKWGFSALESIDVAKLGSESIERLRDEVNETVFMALRSEDHLVYIAKKDSTRSIRTTALLGSTKPLYCTGLGKAFLTFMNQEEKSELLKKMKLERINQHTITDIHQLNQQIVKFHEQGYAIDDEESELGLYCLAAPIYDYSNEMVAAISVAGPKERMLAQKPFILKKLIIAASQISGKMGLRK